MSLKEPTSILLMSISVILMAVFTSGYGTSRESRYLNVDNVNRVSNLNRLLSRWNQSFTGDDRGQVRGPGPGAEPRPTSLPGPLDQDFPDVLRRCFTERRTAITADFTIGKSIIVNCFKAAVILNLVKYLTTTDRKIDLFNGILQLVKVSGPENCDTNSVDSECGPGDTLKWRLADRTVDGQEYLYQKIVKSVVDEHVHSEKNVTGDELGGSGPWTHVMKSLFREEEEKDLRRELDDPRLVSAVNEFSRRYVLRLNFYPGLALRVQRARRGQVTFSVESNDLAESDGSDETPDDRDGRSLSDEEEEEEEEVVVGRKKSHKKKVTDVVDKTEKTDGQKRKRKHKKKQKSYKHFLIPIAIQVALLPFFFKNLFFMAIKALIAGKAALILIVYNILRNAKIEDENQRIRVEHYGYKTGEEYGAWINGRFMGDDPGGPSLSPFHAQRPKA